MSRTFNMVGGGGGKAVLAVTVTNGTATSVTATKSGTSVSLTSISGVWLGELDTGTWAVTATDGTTTAALSVTISDTNLHYLTISLGDLGPEYTELEWVQFGFAWIDTQYEPVSAWKINTKVQLNLVDAYYNFAYAYQASGTSGRKGIGFQINPSSAKIEYYNGYRSGSTSMPFIATVSVNTNDIYTISTNNRSITINGATYTVTDGRAITSAYGVTMLVGRNIKMWYFSLTDANGTTVVRNMVPAKRNSDAYVGMYDKANNIFYPANNQYAMVAGPAV